MNITEQYENIMRSAKAVAQGVPAEDALKLGASIDEMFTQLMHFNQVRRRFRRLRDLAASRPVAQKLLDDVEAKIPAASDSLMAAVGVMRDTLPIVRQMLGENLDIWHRVIWEHDSPLKPRLYAMMGMFGFSSGEVGWAHREMESAAFALSELVASHQDDVLALVLDAVNDGRPNFHLAGFITETGDTEKDARLNVLLSEARNQGITVSLYAVVILHVACALACRVAGNDQGASLWASYF